MWNTQEDIYKDLQVSFYFNVEFQEMYRNGKKISEKEVIPFKEVTGLSSQMDTESVFEGGLNNHEYKLPKRIKHNNLVLKKALSSTSTELGRCLKSTFECYFTQPFIKQNILVSLLNNKGDTMHSWMCTDAYPVKWEVDDFDSEKNKLVIELVEFTYASLEKRK